MNGTPPNFAELETSRLIDLGVPAEAAFQLFGLEQVIRPFVETEQESDDE